MFLGIVWYWWVILIIVMIIIMPVKIKFVKWWSRNKKDKTNIQKDKWGDEQ